MSGEGHVKVELEFSGVEVLAHYRVAHEDGELLEMQILDIEMPDGTVVDGSAIASRNTGILTDAILARGAEIQVTDAELRAEAIAEMRNEG